MFYLIRWIVLCLSIVVVGCSTQQASKNQLSAVEFSELIQTTPQAILLDVRTPEEFDKGHLPNAVNINWNDPEFDNWIAQIDTYNPIFVYCLSGGRSAKAAIKLRSLGFRQVYEMPGGMLEWRQNGLPEVGKTSRGRGLSTSDYQTITNADRLVLVDFYAEWCGPCKKMKPFLKQIEQDMQESMSLARINVDHNPEISQQQGVTSIPLLKLYKDGSLVWQHIGYISEQDLRNILSQFLP